MNSLETIPTKTLQILWDNIHRTSGLGKGAYFDSYTGLYCSIGATTIPMSDRYGINNQQAESLLKNGFNFQAILIENDDFNGTPAERRVHMLQFIGKELMSRKDLEESFKHKVQAVA